MWSCLQTESDNYIGCLKYFSNFQLAELVAHFTSLFGICVVHISFVSKATQKEGVVAQYLLFVQSLDNLSIVLNF